jgi:hypothetical protein
MAKEYKPGFNYYKSNILKQEIAMNKNTGWVYCEDGVRYSPQELLLFCEAGCEIDIGTHLVKRVFAGEVIKIERNIRGDNQAKQIEGGTTNGKPDNSTSGKEIPDTNGDGTGSKDGELDIY